MDKRYKTIGYYSEDDKAYILFAPELPGCFADGETIEEAKTNISVVINEWIEYAHELGREIPEPFTELEITKGSVFDVAEYILSKTGKISTMMLQKLVYYATAWSLAWFHTSLFPQEFEAWRLGPVCRPLFDEHKGKYMVTESDIQSEHNLSDSEKHLIDNVLSVYGGEDPDWLSNLTHDEIPWKETRRGIPDSMNSNRTIDQCLIESYYGKLA